MTWRLQNVFVFQRRRWWNDNCKLRYALPEKIGFIRAKCLHRGNALLLQLFTCDRRELQLNLIAG